MNRKVTVVGGAGNVGATVARCIADKELADVVIVDIADQKAAGIALDILEACPITGSASRVIEESQTRPRGGISSGPLDQPTRSAVSRTAPSRTAPSRVAQASSQGLGTARRPLVTIRFDRPNPAYEQPLYTAVSRALERRPSATFELVGVAANSEIGRAHV